MEERNGHVIWGSWSFDYVVADTEGLCLINGFFRGRYIFNKMSLPVIRVKYTRDEDFAHNPLFGNGCGPYADRIEWDPEDFGENLNPISGPHHLVKISDCGDRYICNRTTTIDGKKWLELAVYARIGAYHIYQSWYLNNDGELRPHVFSKGLSCNLDHWHHPYWRFDFSLDTNSDQRVNVLNGQNYVGFVNLEGRFLNSWNGDAHYNVENLKTGLKAWVHPPVLDPERGIVGPTPFSNIDVNVRKYRSEEDHAWAKGDTNELSFAVHENPDGGDIVFWSIGHLFHHAAEGKDHWHGIGPLIVVQLPPRMDIRPEDCRRVHFQGHINIKDFKLVGKDKWGHFEFDETVTVEPNSPHTEVAIRRGPTGDVTADLLFRIDFNPDRSVEVNFTAELYDEDQRVASVSNHFHVLRDSSIGWSGLHLVDYHRGDPDTADIDFTVNNNQCLGWQQFELASAESASVRGGITAVSRIPSSMELWWIAGNGSVQGAFWYEGSRWTQYELAPKENASNYGGIAAVSRIPSSMEVWWIAPNGSVQGAFWYENSQWKRYELAPAGSASISGGIAAVSRIPSSMEVWWIAPNGSVRGAFWYEESRNWKQYELALPGSASPNGGITAVSRIPSSMEVWWIAGNGSVQGAFWYEGVKAKWKLYDLAPVGSASPNGGITVVSRIPSTMEVWWIGGNGSVQGAFWYEGSPSWTLYELAPSGSASISGGITSVSRISNSMEVWWIGGNGSVQDAFWYEGEQWKRFELASTGKASSSGGITSVSRIPDSLEVWWIGANGSVQDAFWYT